MKQFIIGITILIFSIQIPGNMFASEYNTQIKKSELPSVEVVFVLDTTGSMGGLIDAAKEKIWSIANTLSRTEPAPVIKMGLVGYRDKGDSYVTVVTDLSGDLDSVYAELMDFTADGGGDTPEDVNKALQDSITKISWSENKNTYRVVFLVGDAPPQMGYKNEIKYPEICRKASEHDIIVNTIQCGNMQDTVPFFRDIAKLGGGEYFRVSQDGNAVLYETPYDSELAELSGEFDLTRIYYGDGKVQKMMLKREEKSNDLIRKSKTSAVAKRAVFNAGKSGSKNLGGEKELISSLQEKKIVMDDIESDMLPEFLKKMSRDEQEKYIEDNLLKRKKIQNEINLISEKRQSWIRTKMESENKNDKGTFDFNVYRCIKNQAATKEIAYKKGPEF